MNRLLKTINKHNGNLCFIGVTDHYDTVFECNRFDRTLVSQQSSQLIYGLCHKSNDEYLVSFGNNWLGLYQNGVLNETYVNTTCFNCTNYYNVTNYYNDTNLSLYNNSYLDNNFITNSIFNTFKSSLNYATKDELTNSINSINNTNYITNLEEHTHTWTGIIIFLIFLIQSGTIIYIIYKVREE